MALDLRHWQDFYRNNGHTTEPSPFARSLGIKGCSILELGCGNGRDAYYLAAQGNEVMGIDAAVKPPGVKNVSFLQADVRDHIQQHPCEVDVVYARFFFHSIPEALEDELLDWINCMVAVEARTPTDPATPDHFRRYIEPDKLLTKLQDRGFHVITHKIARGLAPYGDENPEVLRVVARANG